MKKLFFVFIPLFTLAQNPYEVITAIKKDSVIDNRSDFAKQFVFLPFTQWKEGMTFIILPPYYFSQEDDLELVAFNKKNKSFDALKQKDWQYKIFTFKKTEMDKDGIHVHAIFENEGNFYQYQPYFSYSFIKEHEQNDPHLITIKGMTFLKDIDIAKANLLGKRLYILTSHWLQKTEKGQGYMTTGARQFVPVTITQIGLGSPSLPIRMAFKDENNIEAFVDICLGGTNSSAYLSIGSFFDDIFSFSDPKEKYPKISNVIWTVIQQGKIKEGMTEEELLLSWGKPEKINSTIIGAKRMDQYIYENQYVYIDNGRISLMQSAK